MEIEVNESSLSGGVITRTYRLYILYYYKTIGDKIVPNQFDTIDEFLEFITECHPDVNVESVTSMFSKRLELLTRLCQEHKFEKKYELSYVRCFISGKTVVSTMSEPGIHEKLNEYFSMREKVNDGYLNTALATEWTFNDKDSGYVFLNWYYNSESNKTVYKIHFFTNKIVFELPNGDMHSIIVSDRYWAHYGGKKKD